MFKASRWAILIGIVAALVAFIVAPATAGGVSAYNEPVCGKSYVPINMGHGDYFNVYNAQDQSTCVSVERQHLAWYVTSKGNSVHGWQYPNISSGIEWGKYTCYDGRSAYPSSKGSECMRYPVQEYKDGYPLTSVSYWPHLKSGNVAYDIWFNREKVRPWQLQQNDGAEIMIWLAHPGVPVWAVSWHARIQGHEYEVMNWIANHNGKTWNYVAYVAVHPTRSLHPTWLNAFFRDAVKHHMLDKTWWLTSIDFGAEMNSGGQGFAVHTYSLTGVK